MNYITTVQCPICSTKITWHKFSKWRPFCSKRCQLIDLGEWLNEERRLSESLTIDVNLKYD
ncbi:DNA gyrase inhibitor YacG [Candidatus Erwinia haradaeae]|uniref:DNA gyrase inhibitor YacG n=1 Tax=Candidatus Erwinia haradaeae TaxID=1922217 RepID=A0A451DKG0_9GAMM|nr:DNA gyrase inhibitor YacG [Candidatus Erwinia haradaeae]VFP87208.1 DNA gyrase inhibitor YacG [Candidatus Erwinia haradaeae]